MNRTLDYARGTNEGSAVLCEMTSTDVMDLTANFLKGRVCTQDLEGDALLAHSDNNPLSTMGEILRLTEQDLQAKCDDELIEMAKFFDDPMLSAHVEHFQRCATGLEKKTFLSTRKDLIFLLLAASRHKQKEKVNAESSSVGQETAAQEKGRADVPKQMLLPIAHMPTDLCRVSPFFPMSKNEKKSRPFIDSVVIARSVWGEILYTGPKLSTEEEDVLMGLLSVINNPSKRNLTDVKGEATYSYRGPFRPVLESMGKETYGKKEYERAWKSMKLLYSCVLEELRVKKTVKAKGEEEGGVEIRKHTLHKILTDVKWEEDKVLEFTINPFFYQHFIAGSLTRIDLKKRASLVMPIAKHMYRFMKSHQADIWHGHYMKLAQALNIDMTLPAKEIRRYIKDAIRRNIEKGTFEPGSGFTANSKDIVRIIRTKDEVKAISYRM